MHMRADFPIFAFLNALSLKMFSFLHETLPPHFVWVCQQRKRLRLLSKIPKSTSRKICSVRCLPLFVAAARSPQRFVRMKSISHRCFSVCSRQVNVLDSL